MTIDDRPAPGIEAALDRFQAAVAANGGPDPAPPATAEELAALAEAIAPMRLPDDLVAVWRRFASDHGVLANGRALESPAGALTIWREDVWHSQPRCLLPIGYEAHGYCCIELHGPDDEAGRIWAFEDGSEDITRIADGITDLVVAVAAAWEAAAIRTSEGEFQRALIEDGRAWDELVTKAMPRWAVDGWNRLAWPARWLRLSGLDPDSVRPRGPTTTIRALLASKPTGGTVTVAGIVDGLIGAEAGSRVTLDDATEEIDVWIPAPADPFGLVRIDARIEVDLVFRGGRSQRPAFRRAHAGIVRAILGGRLGTAQNEALRLQPLLDPSTAQATGVAVRRSA